MKFCSDCGSSVSHRIPQGDNRPRFICDQCDAIHYQNPRIITGCLVEHQDKILLCRRAISPRKGFWTLPAGFMENGETIEESALRETWEEAEAKVINPELYTVFNLPYINQVYIFYRGMLMDGQFGAGIETLESQLFYEEDIPWDLLAFPTIHTVLKFYYNDCKNKSFPVRIENIVFPSHKQVESQR